MATTLRDLKKSCPICGESLASSGAYDLHVAQAHRAADHGSESGAPQQSQPSPAVRPPARPPSSPLPLLAFVMAVVLAVAGVAVVIDRSGRHARPVVAANTLQPPPSPAGNKALADRIALKLEDFPSGWRLEPHESGGNAAGSKEISDCTDSIDATKGQNTQTARSPSFTAPPFSTAEASVDVNPTVAVAKADFATLDPVMSCLHDAFNKAVASGAFGILPKGVTAKVGPVETLATFPYGDQSAARRITMTIQGPGGSIPLSFDVRLMRRQRIVAALLALTNGSTLTADQEQELVGKMAARMP